jgi:hypothetical protein
MSAQHARPSPAIDLAELEFGLGSSAEEIADFLQRDVEDVRHKAAVEAQRVLPGALSRSSSSRISAPYFRIGKLGNKLPKVSSVVEPNEKLRLLNLYDRTRPGNTARLPSLSANRLISFPK